VGWEDIRVSTSVLAFALLSPSRYSNCSKCPPQFRLWGGVNMRLPFPLIPCAAASNCPILALAVASGELSTTPAAVSQMLDAQIRPALRSGF